MPLFRLTLALLLPASVAAQAASGPPLVVLISVDQLRGDLPLHYADRFGDDGFRRFIDRGVVYTDAHYGHSTTYTASGHATLGTGGNPREHGIIGNSWIDAATGQSVYCVEDRSHKLLGKRTAPSAGTSPKNLLMPTIGDMLLDASNGAAKVFSISRKDRAAILMGGKKGKAFWYDGGSGAFITSDYYYDAYPAWVTAWNEVGRAARYKGTSWNLLRPESEYERADTREGELIVPMLGSTFPHDLSDLSDRQLYGALSNTPFSDELVIEFSEAAIEAEDLGQRGVTDMLMLGLSATDSIGHAWGPDSREQEDNLLRLDALLERFFAYLDGRFGEGKVVVFLSADHGVDGLPKSGSTQQLDPVEMVKTAETALAKRYGEDAKYIHRFSTPYIYFTPAIKKECPDDIAAMEDVVAETLLKVHGVAYALPSHRIAAGELDGDDPVMQRVYRAYHPVLRGDVFVIQSPYTHIYSGSPRYTATHGTPYAFDTHVPVMVFGPGIAAQRIDDEVGPESIVPTIAALLGIQAPPGAKAPVLKEVVGAR